MMVDVEVDIKGPIRARMNEIEATLAIGRGITDFASYKSLSGEYAGLQAALHIIRAALASRDEEEYD